MLTSRDIKIIEFSKRFGITINQCYRIFYNQAKYGMDLARKRLKKLHNEGHLLRGKSWDTNKTVYYLNRIPSTHRILLGDFYSELIYRGADIKEFITEFKTSNLRADALTRYIINGYEVIQFVEIVLTNKVNINKYEDLKETGEIQKQYGLFPSIVIVDHNPIDYNSKSLKISCINHDMREFDKVLP